MEALESKIGKVDADYAAAGAAYKPLATVGDGATAWQSLQDNVAAIAQPVERALELSRRNRDEEARAVMMSIEDRFDAIARAAATLIQINRDEANRTVARVRSLQWRTTWFLIALTVSGTMAALFVAAWVTRALERRDEQLRLAALRLEEQNRELDAFSGRVAHDLRGPLTTVSMVVTRLTEKMPQEEGSLSILRRGVGRMEGLIKDLLALSQIDAQISDARCETASVVAAVEADLRPTVERANGRLRVDVEAATLRCKDRLMHQVLWNVGENAVKYRRADAPLEVSIQGRAVGPSYELRVSDNGPGMSPIDARRVFEPFFRAEETRSTTPGTGLGLSIVKRIVEASRGTVAVESQAGRGSTFVIRLPLDAPAAAGR